MTTDLRSKTVEELVEESIYTRFAAQELARRLEEVQQQLELYAAEMSAAREAGFYSAQELWSAYQTVQQRNAAHDAKVAAEALEEAIWIMVSLDQAEAGPKCWDDPVKYCTNLLRDKAAEYLAKAGRKE